VDRVPPPRGPAAVLRRRRRARGSSSRRRSAGSGNWFNQELYGPPTTLPWGLEIYERVDPATGLPDLIGGVAVSDVPIAVVHPTFLYELLWNLGVAALLVWADRRFRLGHGRAFALYVAGYTAGRFWIELLRTDSATTVFGGIRINVVVSVVVFVGAVLYIALAKRGREEPFATGDGADGDAAAIGSASADDDRGADEAGRDTDGPTEADGPDRDPARRPPRRRAPRPRTGPGRQGAAEPVREHPAVTFSGFGEDAIEFYDGLTADNSKAYWTDRRHVYERDVRGPMQELLAACEAEFGPGKIFRPYRDVRFSSDKTPYKTHCGATAGGFYVRSAATG
jgi:hypothetical protein